MNKSITDCCFASRIIDPGEDTVTVISLANGWYIR